MLRSWLGKQERYRLWQVLEQEEAAAEGCRLSASPVGRRLEDAGKRAQAHTSSRVLRSLCDSRNQRPNQVVLVLAARLFYLGQQGLGRYWLRQPGVYGHMLIAAE